MTQSAALRLSPRVGSVGQARRAARDALVEWNAEDFEWVLCQLVSELATNAVLHAGTTFEISLQLSAQRLRCEVSDGNPRPARVRRYGAESATGRGLKIVEQLAAEWGVTERPDGKTVWFELHAGDARGKPSPVPDGQFDLSDVGELADVRNAADSQRPAPRDAGRAPSAATWPSGITRPPSPEHSGTAPASSANAA